MSKINSWGSDDPAEVAKGGSGRGSQIAYSVLCGGTTTTAAQQSVASVGSSGQILTSTGAGSLPSFQTAAGGGGTDWTLITTVDTSSGSGPKTVTSGLGTAYEEYRIVYNDVGLQTDTATLSTAFSDDGGSTYVIEIQGLENTNGSSPSAFSTPTVTTVAIASANFVNGYFHFTGNKIAVDKDLVGVLNEITSGTVIDGSKTFLASLATNLDVDGFSFTTSTGDFDAGSITIYGR